MSRYKKQSKFNLGIAVILVLGALVAFDGWIWMLTVGSLHGSFGHPVQTISWGVAAGQAILIATSVAILGAAFRGNK